MAVVFACGSAVQAESGDINTGDWEAGLLLGEPTGFSAKFWTTWNSAIDFGLAWSFGKNGNVHIHADYLFHNFDFFDIEEGMLPVYFGVGGRIRLEDDDSRIGVRLVIGMEYVMADHPLAFFLEVAPIVDFAPETESDVNGGLGLRYIF